MISQNAVIHSGQPVVTVSGSADALPLEGTVLVNTAGVDALTLASPTSGAIANGGDDGRVLRIKSNTANAHTITVAANKFNGDTHIATMSGAVTNFIELIAIGGVWHVLASSGITLS